MHPHPSCSNDTSSLAEKNAKHFDKNVAQLQKEWPQWILDLHGQITSFLTSPTSATWLNLPIKPEGTKLLDYACGHGIITSALHPKFDTCIGLDVSAEMLAWYRATAAHLGLDTNDKILAVRGDLTSEKLQETEPPLPAERLEGFDLIAISMALHHLPSPALAIQRLVSRRLKVGGTILVIDWTPLDGSTPAQREYLAQAEREGKADEARKVPMPKNHDSRHTISAPDGFTKADMQRIFEDGGCSGVKWEVAEELTFVEPAGVRGQMFFACATKDAA